MLNSWKWQGCPMAESALVLSSGGQEGQEGQGLGLLLLLQAALEGTGCSSQKSKL